MKGSEYIELARQHLRSSDESNFRCAVSRFYYGLLIETMDYITKYGKSGSQELREIKNKTIKDQGVHTVAIRNIKHAGLKGQMQIAKQFREWADYYYDTDLSKHIFYADKIQENTLPNFNRDGMIEHFECTYQQLKKYISDKK